MIDCPTFIDLRALLSSAPAAAGQDDPFGADARKLPVRAGPCTLLAISLPSGSGNSAGLAADTWVLVDSGAVILTGPAGDIELGEGQSAVIARGTPFAWRTGAQTSLIGMDYPDGAVGEPGIVAIDNGVSLAPSNPPAAHLLLGETPTCRSGNQFASGDELFKSGIWDSTPYQRTPIFFHHTELMHLLAGEVTFTDAAGRSATFSKGDTYIIEQGAECSWESHVDVAKIYALFRPVV
ncbi:MAG: cupin domain-containing protein [Novosphingobium sp.]